MRPGFSPMKKPVLQIALILMMQIFLFLSATGAVYAKADSIPATDETGIRIAVASDLHFDPDNTAKGPEATAVQYNMELVDALLWDAKQQGAEMVLLTGDLVNGGKYSRHAALAEKLRDAEHSGIDIYVLPGNHDLAPMTQAEFARYYAAFGYGEAYSRDASSLSYCILREGLMILMMDTAGYPASAIDLADAPARENNDPFFSEETLLWAESCMKTAQEKDLRILAAGHYNLLPAISREPGSGYCIERGDRFTELLRQYEVPLYLSGHMHIRDVYQEKGLTELLTEYLLGYPAAYSMLELSENRLTYMHRRIDVNAWAAEKGESDPVLLNYSDWQQIGLYNSAVENIEYMSKRNPLTDEEKKSAASFFYTVMNAFWDGSLSEKRGSIEKMPGYEPFFRCAEGYAYGWWLKNLIDAAVPELAGFELVLR